VPGDVGCHRNHNDCLCGLYGTGKILEDRGCGMKKDFSMLSDYAEELFAAGFSQKKVYEHILMEFYGTPYIYGRQSPDGSDCSGSVCSAMSLATGKNVRVTADTLFKDFFTEDVKIFNKESFLYAAFFLDENGKAVHVSGWSLGMFMNVSRREPGQKGNWRTEAELRRLYPHLLMIKRGMKI